MDKSGRNHFETCLCVAEVSKSLGGDKSYEAIDFQKLNFQKCKKEPRGYSCFYQEKALKGVFE